MEGRKFGDSRLNVKVSEMSGIELSVGAKNETSGDDDDDVDFYQHVYDFLVKKELPQNAVGLNQSSSTVYFLNEAANYCVSFINTVISQQ